MLSSASRSESPSSGDPIGNVMAIYAKENGQGMSFPVDRSTPTPTPEKNTAATKGKPSLKIVK